MVWYLYLSESPASHQVQYQETKKAIERLNTDIAAQVRNLREADDALKRFIQDDIKELRAQLFEKI